jgi:hypothetical protein
MRTSQQSATSRRQKNMQSHSTSFKSLFRRGEVGETHHPKPLLIKLPYDPLKAMRNDIS